MDTNKLDEFSINGLNGDSNVNLKFVDNLKVIVSENGYGKTTVISLLYSFFKKSRKINKFNFKSLEIKFHGEETIVYPKDIISVLFENEFLERFDLIVNNFEFPEGLNMKNSFLISFIIYFIFNGRSNFNDLSEIKKLIDDLGVKDERVIPLILNVKGQVESYNYYYDFDKLKVDFKSLYEGVNVICKHIDLNPIDKNGLILFRIHINKLLAKVESLGNKEFIYLPTYRLIESNISSFKKDDEDEDYAFGGVSDAKEFFKDNPLIQFGVDDIKEVWASLSNRIRLSTTQGFIKLSGSLLNNIINNKPIKKKNVKDLLEDKKSIQKVLSRIDLGAINAKDKSNLLNVIEMENFDFKDNSAFFYILENMVHIYNSQKYLDETINKYKDVVNCFFNNKYVVFDEVTSEIYVNKKKTGARIDIENLSSGEKQILSLFTKIYLSDFDNLDKKYWIFFDEPEISLSIEWQQILLPKIIESNRCEFLIAATHSPFIFKNDLKKYTSDLSLEMTELI